MAEITITATLVDRVSGGVGHGDAGETILAGQPLYIKDADGLLWKADSNAAAVETSAVVGIALNGGAAGQAIAYQKTGTITIGGTVVPGAIYVLGFTAGLIVPSADLASGNRVTILGTGQSATVIKLLINNTGCTV